MKINILILCICRFKNNFKLNDKSDLRFQYWILENYLPRYYFNKAYHFISSECLIQDIFWYYWTFLYFIYIHRNKYILLLPFQNNHLQRDSSLKKITSTKRLQNTIPQNPPPSRMSTWDKHQQNKTTLLKTIISWLKLAARSQLNFHRFSIPPPPSPPLSQRQHQHVNWFYCTHGTAKTKWKPL